MDINSWFRRSVSKLINTSAATAAAGNTSKSKLREDEEEKLYGITHQLIEFIKSLSIDTFKNFPLPDEEESAFDGGGDSGTVRADLSDWQEKHAMLVLSRVKELAQLRFRLSPRYLKERQFWRIYFTLVKNYVAEYELQAVRLAKVRQIKTSSETVSDSSAYEVEMSEAKFISSAESGTS